MLLEAHLKYTREKARIAYLEENLRGEKNSTPIKPIMVFERIRPDGHFGIVFNSQISGLGLLEDL